ncbi:MAG: hypothetical protein ACP5ME_06695 [Anaerolineae bacterium]
MKKSLLLSLLIGLFVVHLILFKGFIVDDAFITFRYVQQWVHGHGLVYNVGERVEGYSNFLWIVSLAPFARLGVELTLAAKAMGALLCLLTLLLVWKASGQIGHPRIAPWLLAVSSPFAAWALGGLETPLFTFLLFLSGSLFLKEEEEEKGWLSGPLFGLLALSRPEGLLFALSTVLFRIWYLYRLKKTPIPPRRVACCELRWDFYPVFPLALGLLWLPSPQYRLCQVVGASPPRFSGGWILPVRQHQRGRRILFPRRTAFPGLDKSWPLSFGQILVSKPGTVCPFCDFGRGRLDAPAAVPGPSPSGPVPACTGRISSSLVSLA